MTLVNESNAAINERRYSNESYGSLALAVTVMAISVPVRASETAARLMTAPAQQPIEEGRRNRQG